MTLALPLERSQVSAQLARLLRVFKKPEQAPADDLEFATDYTQICGELAPEQFTGAVDAYLRGNAKWFPKPGELLALGRDVARGPAGLGDLQGRYLEWERAGYEDPVAGGFTPCPVCSATVQAHVVCITPEGREVERLMVLHHAAVHWKAKIGFTGRAMPGSGGGGYEHHVIDHRTCECHKRGRIETRLRAAPAPAAQLEADLERAAIQAEGAP